MTQLAEHWRAASGRQKMAIIAALIYLIYAVIVYFAGSSMLRQTIVEELQNTTDRSVSLERAVIDPTGLAVTLTNFRFDDPDGEAFVAFDRLYVDFELSSLFRWSWHFDVVELDAPRIRVSQTGAKAFNFDDLLTLGGDQTESEPEPSAPAALPALSIGELRLAGGDFRFIDLTRGEAQELVLDDLDFEILDFSTRSDGEDGNQYALAIASPDGGRFDWTGRLNVDPLILDGRLELSGLALAPFAEFYQDRLLFQLRDGELDIATAYLLDMSGEVPLVQLNDGRIALTELEVRQPELDDDTLVLPELVFSGISVNSATETVAVTAIDIDGLAVLARQTESGVDLASVFVPLPPPVSDAAEEDQLEATPDDQAGVEEDAELSPSDVSEEEQGEAALAAETPKDAEAEATSGWRAKVDRVAIAQGQFVFRDETLLTPAQLAATEMALTLTNLTWGEEGEFAWQGGMTLADQDQLTLSGTGTLQPLTLQAAVSSERLSLLPLEPWLRESASVDLVAGNLAFDFGATLTEGEDAPALSLQIAASLSELALTELDGEPLLSLALADVDQVAVDFDEPGVAVGQVTVTGLNLSSVIDEQGRHTGDRVVVPVQAPVHVGETPVWHISLEEFDLRDSEVVFRDDSQSAPFSLGLYRLNVNLAGVDTASEQAAQLRVSADVDRYAPLSVEGELKLASDEPHSDVTVNLQNYEMTSLTAYTGRYIGYEVSTGQLSMNTQLMLTGTVLDSETRLQADNFFLGEKVESEEAIKAPIKLGLAVLRNKAGEIRLPIKASGDLSDPSVSVSGIILKALGNVLVKAATSPFSALAGLAGGESLENVLFEPGSAEVSADARDRLSKLAGILADRPALKVKLAGAFDSSDRRALASSALQDQLWRGQWPGLEVALADEGFQTRVLRREAELNGAEVAVDPAQTPEQRRDQAEQAYEALLTQQMADVPDDTLVALAAQRASAAKAYLVETLAVDAARLFIQGSAMSDRDPVSGVQLDLEL